MTKQNKPQSEPTDSRKYKAIWVSPDTHHAVKAAASTAGMSMKDYVEWLVKAVGVMQ